MKLIAIDGACRRNGQPNCVSAGGVFIIDQTGYDTIKTFECGSTNQRGELMALIEALKVIAADNEEACVITDSEYLFNAMTKDWLPKWAANDWVLSSGDGVKNQDLWYKAYTVLQTIHVDIAYFHIKGHCIPFGEVTARNLLLADQTGEALYKEALLKYDKARSTKIDKIQKANELSMRNNGFYLPEEILRNYIALNIVVDAVATEAVNQADSEIRSFNFGRS